MEFKVLATFFSLYLVMNIIGITYLCFGNIYSHSYTGILKSGSVYSDTSCSTSCDKNGKNCITHCSNSYYVDEIFYKNINSQSTCTVRRPTKYYFKGDADNFVSRMILGTSRKLYQTTYSHGTCIDDKIKYLYNCTGIVLVTCANAFLIILTFISFYINFNQYPSNFERQEIPHSSNGTEMYSISQNNDNSDFNKHSEV